MSEQIEVDAFVSVSQLEVLDAAGTYLASSGGFLPERMLSFWEAKARQGPPGARLRPEHRRHELGPPQPAGRGPT